MGGVVSTAGGILTGGTSTLGQALGVAQNQAPVQTAAAGVPLALAGSNQAVQTAAGEFPIAAAQLPGTTQIGQLTTPLANIATQQSATAQPLLSTGMNQFQQGAQGQLTPGMEQVVQNALNNANTVTNANYNRMGIGGSTMQAQDLGQNQDQAAQLRANLAAQAEQLGMSAVNEGLGALGQAAGTTMDEASLYSNLANLQLSQNAQMLGALNNLTQAQFTQVAQELASLNNLTNAQFTSQGQQLSALGALANAQAGQQSNLFTSLGNLGSALGNAASGIGGGTGGGLGSVTGVVTDPSGGTTTTYSSGAGDYSSSGGVSTGG